MSTTPVLVGQSNDLTYSLASGTSASFNITRASDGLSGVADGELLVLIVSVINNNFGFSGNEVQVDTPSGWTLLSARDWNFIPGTIYHPFGQQAVFFKNAASEPATYSVTVRYRSVNSPFAAATDTANAAVKVLRYTGHNPVTPFDRSNLSMIAASEWGGGSSPGNTFATFSGATKRSDNSLGLYITSNISNRTMTPDAATTEQCEFGIGTAPTVNLQVATEALGLAGDGVITPTRVATASGSVSSRFGKLVFLAIQPDGLNYGGRTFSASNTLDFGVTLNPFSAVSSYVAPGDTHVVVVVGTVESGAAPTFNTPSGYTKLVEISQAAAAGASTTAVFYRTYDGAESGSVSFTVTSPPAGQRAFTAFGFRIAEGGPPTYQTSSGTTTAPAVTGLSATAGNILVYIASLSRAGAFNIGAETPPAALDKLTRTFNNRSVASNTLVLGKKISGGGASGTETWTPVDTHETWEGISLSIGPPPLTVAVGQASELDVATSLMGLYPALAVESDTAQTFAVAHGAAVDQAEETDTALVITPLSSQAINQATEVDTATALIHMFRRTMERAVETDTGQGLYVVWDTMQPEPIPLYVEMDVEFEDNSPADEYVEPDPPEEPEPVPPGDVPILPVSDDLSILRVIRTAPDAAPFVGDNGRFDVTGWKATFPDPVYALWGRPRLRIKGKDVTFFRGIPVQIEDWDDTDPFGFATATFRFPQILPFEQKPAWLYLGARVDLDQRHPDGVTFDKIWEGTINTIEDDGDDDPATVIQCIGPMLYGDYFLRHGRATEDLHPDDIGKVIKDVVSPYERGHGSWPIKPIARKVLGVEMLSPGGWDQLVTGFVADCVRRAQTPTKKYTILMRDTGRQPYWTERDMTTQHYSIHIMEEGVKHHLITDATMGTTTIYGEGTDPDNCRWRNTKFPNFLAQVAPIFFGTPIGPAPDSSHNDSLMLFEQCMYDRGWLGFTVDGVYTAKEEKLVRRFQKGAGITVDGIIGPQTWAAAFQIGSDASDVGKPHLAPLASMSYTEHYLYSPDGARIGINPNWDPRRIRVERFEMFGSHIYKEEAIDSAELEIEENHEPGWYGTLKLEIDPPEKSRFELKSGRNILVRGHEGVDRLMHIARSAINWKEQITELTVDEKARDYLTLAAMIERDRTTHDPSRHQKRSYKNKEMQPNDTMPTWDCENGSGLIPFQAITKRRWQVNRIAASKLGNIVRISIGALPMGRMAVGVWDRPVTANQLQQVGWDDPEFAQYSGDPLFYHDFWKVAPGVDAVESWGDSRQPGGYYPGLESAGDPLTGSLIDEASWYYKSKVPPWLWVGLWWEGSPEEPETEIAYIVGRLFYDGSAN